MYVDKTDFVWELAHYDKTVKQHHLNNRSRIPEMHRVKFMYYLKSQVKKWKVL